MNGTRLTVAALGWLILAVVAALAAANEQGVAVVIGNRHYQDDVPEVSYAHRDAEAFKRYVLEALGYDPDNVIDLRDATQAQMVATFGNEASAQGNLWSYLDPAGGSDVVVFYSGHGVPGQRDGKGYLLAADADQNVPELNAYPIDLLYANLAKLDEAGSVAVFLDACFSGGSQRGMLVENASPVYVTAALPATVTGAMTVLTAASGKQLASWDPAAGHGMFTHHLLDALYGKGDANGDGRVSAAEAKGYLDRHMTRAARRAYKRNQVASLLGDGDMALAFSGAAGYPTRPLLGTPSRVRRGAPDRASRSRGVGDRFRDCSECPEMVVLPPGRFRMGSPSGERGRHDDEGPLHEVNIAEPFALGRYEVTVSEFGRFVEDAGHTAGSSCMTYADGEWKSRAGFSWRNPGFGQNGGYPVACVSWDDAKAYAGWLSRKTGKSYRLPSESEWEYAARAGTLTARYWGEGESGQCGHANGADASAKERYLDWKWPVSSCRDGHVHASPVGSFGANGWGLHDMLGNAREWTEDCWNGSYEGAPSDGSAWEYGDCDRRVLRGGSWFYSPSLLRAAYRGRSATGDRSNVSGFRVARTLTP